MHRDPNIELSPQTTLPTRSAPRFNVISVVAPILGFICGCAVSYVLNDQFGWWAGHALEAGIHTLGWFIVIGFLCAVIALVRVEKWWGVTAVGLVVNGIVLISFWVKQTSIWPGLWPEP